MQQNKVKKPLLVLVTGFSGAGLTTAINSLQDSGLYCIDNLPLEMMIPTFKLLEKQDLGSLSGYGMGIHIHKDFSSKKFAAAVAKLKTMAQVDVISLTADRHVLARRYNASRRPHPLVELGFSLIEAIEKEKQYLDPLQEVSNFLLDTSSLSPHELKRIIENRYKNLNLSRVLHVTFISFGFKHGQYKPLDNMFDVRFLDNPYFHEHLKKQTGKDQAVMEFFEKNLEIQEFIDRLLSWFEWILPRYFEEGKHYLRVGIGCTGGKHRSVYTAEQLMKRLPERQISNMKFHVVHCDVDKP